MSLRVTLVQGGGLGLDQVPAVKRILDAAGVPIEWDEHFAGLASCSAAGRRCRRPCSTRSAPNGIALKTKLLSPPGDRKGNYNVQFRRNLGLFASVRPLKNLRGSRRDFTASICSSSAS